MPIQIFEKHSNALNPKFAWEKGQTPWTVWEYWEHQGFPTSPCDALKHSFRLTFSSHFSLENPTHLFHYAMQMETNENVTEVIMNNTSVSKQKQQIH